MPSGSGAPPNEFIKAKAADVEKMTARSVEARVEVRTGLSAISLKGP